MGAPLGAGETKLSNRDGALPWLLGLVWPCLAGALHGSRQQTLTSLLAREDEVATETSRKDQEQAYSKHFLK